MTSTLSTTNNDPASLAGWDNVADRKGFFTDTSICIGCKACEVACKEWNEVPDDGFEWSGDSYDNTGALGASTWRHVAFIEQPARGAGVDTNSHSQSSPNMDFRWLMSSDVCKHCTEAACLDVCPTGALFRTEFGTVVVQDNVCNGCGYCVPACPFGVIDRREGPIGAKNVGIAQKCTLCYDRLGAEMTPACAQACPTESIQFGNVDELRQRAQIRVESLRRKGVVGARLYGHDPSDGIGGAGAIFLLLDQPEVYGLPPNPVVTTRDLPKMWKKAAIAATLMFVGAAASHLKR